MSKHRDTTRYEDALTLGDRGKERGRHRNKRIPTAPSFVAKHRRAERMG